MKDKFGGKIIAKFVGLRVKTYSFLLDDGSEDKKEKCTKTCLVKRKLKFENYENYLKKLYLKQLFRSNST